MAFPPSQRVPLDLPGAQAPTRYVGGTAAGAPLTGTFALGDFVIDETGFVWICTAAGTPGTWVSGQASGGITNAGATAIASGTGGVSGDTTIATNGSVIATFGFGGNTNITNQPTITMQGSAAANGSSVSVQPLFNIKMDYNDGFGSRTRWQKGIDSSNAPKGRMWVDMVRYYDDGTHTWPLAQDIEAWADYGTDTAPICAHGVGIMPPPSGYRQSIYAPNSTAWGVQRLNMGASGTGPYLSAFDSAGHTMFQFNNDGSLRGIDNVLNAGGLLITDVGSDASNVLSVAGRSSASAAIFRVLVSGASGEWRIARDGTTDVQARLHASGGTDTVILRIAGDIATLTAGQDADRGLVIAGTATATGAHITAKKGATTVFSVSPSGSVSLNNQLNYTNSASETTGAGSAALGANCPAATATAPYKWWKVVTADGSAGFIPVWK